MRISLDSRLLGVELGLSYRNNNLGSGITAGLSWACAVGGDVEDLSQLDRTIGISHIVSNDGVAKLSDEVGKSIAALDDEGEMSRA